MKEKPGSVRIIGGKWRSRRLQVLEEGVRPTPDAVRETLFNWLAPYLSGACCLDLFSGTGALGFEALSRGAVSTDFVDGSKKVIDLLKKESEKFLCMDGVNFFQLKLPGEIKKLPQKSYDIVFIDAPYYQNWVFPCCEWLEQNHYLAARALIYVEMEKEHALLELNANWQLLRQKTAGKVAYYLYRYTR